MDASSTGTLPSIQTPFGFHSHLSSLDYDIHTSLILAPVLDSNPVSPISATTNIGYGGPTPTDDPLMWITLVSMPHLFHHPSHTLAITSSTQFLSSSTNTTPALETATTAPTTQTSIQPMHGGISKGAKVGIALGIAVTAVLVLLALVIYGLDCRHRLKRRRAKRQNRNAELSILESELKNGRTAGREIKAAGLWDDLRFPASAKNGGGPKERLEKTECKKFNLWEHIGAVRNDTACKAPDQSERDIEWLPPYVPMHTKRTSVISSAVSVSLPIMSPSAHEQSFLNIEDRR
ncbi:hypothetical protein CC78DRAFT_612584 [Lojkania enalia]|uniref:Uncharacterized protein n=1 Tax=Lojkania enalia TaxID=147567 RepID=A0A9P4N9J4_9PLEO|nr:hypothetical protein CC78DRAFT_612584 [Didymosphaeria enalia]